MFKENSITKNKYCMYCIPVILAISSNTFIYFNAFIYKFYLFNISVSTAFTYTK